jgi:hypothetical protein
MAPEFLAVEITISGVFNLSVSCSSGSISYMFGLAFLLGMRANSECVLLVNVVSTF